MLRILSGKDVPDAGEYSFRDGVRVSFLEQEPVLTDNPAQSIEDFVNEASAEVLEIIRVYNEALKKV